MDGFFEKFITELTAPIGGMQQFFEIEELQTLSNLLIKLNNTINVD